jgi:ATP-binding cassette subfamily C protein LapB
MQIPEGGGGLSGGQKQLVHLTRLLLRRPKIWLLDEPTAALDRGTEAALINVLRRSINTETLVLVTHKAELLELVDRVIVIANQRIVHDGPRLEVISKLQERV